MRVNEQVRRVSFIIAWCCVPVALIVAAIWAPPPGNQPEPREAETIFRPTILVTTNNGDYRLVAFEQFRNYQPVYALTLLKTGRQTVRRNFGFEQRTWYFGFFRSHAEWHYRLDATRFDAALHEADNSPASLPASELKKVRALVVTELNRRAAGRGRLLAEMLDRGLLLEKFWCWQNVLTILAYLVIPLTLTVFAQCILRTRQRPAPPPPPDCAPLPND